MAGAEGMTRKDELSVPQCPRESRGLCTAWAGSAAQAVAKNSTARPRVNEAFIPNDPLDYWSCCSGGSWCYSHGSGLALPRRVLVATTAQTS